MPDHEEDDEALSSDLTQTVFDPLKSGLQIPKEQLRTQVDYSVLEAELCTPQNRVNHAVLIIVDDHSATDGEIIRIRKREYLIGRKEGDLTIESDHEMSGKHALLECKSEKGRFRWRLTDAGSTNGTFVRVARAPLTDGRELRLGLQRYRIELRDPDEQADQPSAPQLASPPLLRGGAIGAAGVRHPLRLVNTADSEQYYDVLTQRAMLGSNPRRCAVAIDDRCLNAEHARLMYKRGRWQIEDDGSLNGVWVRVRSVWLDRHAEFQLGEQRFRFFADGQIP